MLKVFLEGLSGIHIILSGSIDSPSHSPPAANQVQLDKVVGTEVSGCELPGRGYIYLDMRVMVVDILGEGFQGAPEEIYNTRMRLNNLNMVRGVIKGSQSLASASRVQDQHPLRRNHMIGEGKGAVVKIF